MQNTKDKYRYHPYEGTEVSQDSVINNGFKRQHKCYYQYSLSRCNDRLHQKNQANVPSQRPRGYQYSSTKSSDRSAKAAAIPYERESWIHSVKNAKLNESIEQKTQYLETILRMPQHTKSSTNSTTFDRIRFSSEPGATLSNITENYLGGTSSHVNKNVNYRENISAVEKVLPDESLQTTIQQNSNVRSLPMSSSFIINCDSMPNVNIRDKLYCGFLIDNCEDIIQDSSVSSPTHSPDKSRTSEQSIGSHEIKPNRQCMALMNEFNAADSDRRKLSRREKRLRKKRLQMENNKIKHDVQHKQSLESITQQTTYLDKRQKSSSARTNKNDGLGTDRISQLVKIVRKLSATMDDQKKAAKVEMLLQEIKRQQIELRILKRAVMSMLSNGENRNIPDSSCLHSNAEQDLLALFINQPILSGCWLCSGKAFTEVASQCNDR